VSGVQSRRLSGAGKTSLIEQTIHQLAGHLRLAVIDGDIAATFDADRAAAAGALAVQINTGASVTWKRSCFANALPRSI
jgi:hydrogenase nickel incorporation protein HypB